MNDIRINLDPTIPKVLIIAFLLFAEGIVVPTYTVITQNRWPTSLEFAGFTLSALIQLITYVLLFVETGQTQPTGAPAAPK